MQLRSRGHTLQRTGGGGLRCEECGIKRSWKRRQFWVTRDCRPTVPAATRAWMHAQLRHGPGQEQPAANRPRIDMAPEPVTVVAAGADANSTAAVSHGFDDPEAPGWEGEGSEGRGRRGW